jgi:hypothetical protein
MVSSETSTSPEQIKPLLNHHLPPVVSFQKGIIQSLACYSRVVQTDDNRTMLPPSNPQRSTSELLRGWLD